MHRLQLTLDRTASTKCSGVRTLPATCAAAFWGHQVFPLWRIPPRRKRWKQSSVSPNKKNRKSFEFYVLSYVRVRSFTMQGHVRVHRMCDARATCTENFFCHLKVFLHFSWYSYTWSAVIFLSKGKIWVDFLEWWPTFYLARNTSLLSDFSYIPCRLSDSYRQITQQEL